MKRRVGLVGLIGLVTSLALAPSAFGQGAALVLSPSTAPPGTLVNVTGTGFNSTSATIGGVDIRLSTRDAEPLANSSVTPQNTISASFPVPPGTAPGEYLVIATQRSVRGRDTFGGPGRAKLRVVAARSAAAGGNSPSDLPPAAIGGMILGLLALAGGSAYGVRWMRTARTRPSFSR